MKKNVCLISSLRQPLRSFLLLILFGLISFGFVTKAVEFILVQRETGALGSYYRSIGILESINDPQSGDISPGIELIRTNPYFAFGDQREVVSGVMSQTYNENRIDSNNTVVMQALPKEYWPNTHTYDLWFIGELIDKQEVKTRAKQPENKQTIGYFLKFNIDTLFAADPKYATQGNAVALLFMFEGHEAAIPIIDEIEVGQRYFIHGWDDGLGRIDPAWENTHFAYLQIKPLDDEQLWYIPLEQGASIDFGDPAMAPFKNEIDVLNENLHTLSIIATADMSAMPRTQEASRHYYLTAGRWLNHQDDLAGNKAIVVPESFAKLRGLKLGDELQLTFRPLKDTFFGLIRDGMDSLNWRSYPTYQDTFKIVGLYNRTTSFTYYAYVPTSSLRPGYASSTQNQFRGEADYSFVLDSSRHETEFIQEYKTPLQDLGISLTFLENNGPTYWAAVDPIRRSLSADLLVFGMLMIVTLILAVFLYEMQRKRDYAILRALGVPVKQANQQMITPLLLLGGLGIIVGDLPAWTYALDQAKASLSTIPTPAGIYPSADLSFFVLIGLCAAMFLLLAFFSWLGVLLLANKPVYELLQGETFRPKGRQKRIGNTAISQAIPSSSILASTVDVAENTLQELPVSKASRTSRNKYTPFSLRRYVLHHMLRSRLKSFLTLAIALGFMLALAWIWQTMERSQLEVDRLYDTTVVEADILQSDPSGKQTGQTLGVGNGFVYLKTIENVSNSDFVKSSVLEADTLWFKILKLDSQEVFSGYFPVYAYNTPEAFYSGLADPGSLNFAPGWNMNLFAQQRTLEEIQNEGIVCLFPASLLEQLQVNVGETVRITDQSSHTYNCFIAGQYSGGRVTTVNSIKSRVISSAGDPILIPLSTLKAMDGSKTKFTVAHFILDPKQNRRLSEFRAEMEKAIKEYGGKVHIVIWDEELRVVIAQLDKNISLLRVLYPVVIVVSVLIGAGLCFLLLLQMTREAAILRVLGTTKSAVRLVFIIEPFFLSIIGAILGWGVARFLWITSDPVPLWLSTGLYLAGVLAGSVIGAIWITNKKPIELLQVKE